MSKKLQKPISILTSVTTTLWLSGLAMLAPMSALAVDVVDGDLIRNPSAAGMAQFDIYIVKLAGAKKFKRLILSPHVFESYKHFDKNGDGNNWNDVMDVSQAVMDGYVTSDLVREISTDPVYRLHAEEGADTGSKYWLNMTAETFTPVFDAESIYTINGTDSAGYTAGANVTDPNAAFPPSAETSEGTLTVALAADTPAAGSTVPNAARVPFTKINLTASNGDVTVDSLTVKRVGLAQDAALAGLDVIDGDTNLSINETAKTLNSVHEATFNDDIKVANGTTKPIILSANMAASLTNYAGETPALSLTSITLKGTAALNGTLPITGNAMTNNSTITIGSATVGPGAYQNATSSSIQVGKQDYTFMSFQVQAGSTEKVEFSQVKIYQQGSASLSTDLKNMELLAETTKIADGVVKSNQYVTFNFDKITLDKGQIKQFQVRADVESGSARTVDLGIYRTTDLLVKGVTYNYNITPTYSGAGTSSGNPVLSDREFTISNGTVEVQRSNEITATNIAVANNQYLGAFKFTVKGESVDVSALTLTITSSTSGNIEDALTGVELVDPNGNVVAGPTDITNNAVTVAWTDTFTAPIGDTVYKVRADLATNGGWSTNDTIYVKFTPSAMTIRGGVTSNTITATPSSSVSGNTQTVKAAALTVTRNTLPADGNIIVNQQAVTLTSWNFDASNSGEDIRITQIAFAGRGQSATNTGSLTVYADGVQQSPINDAISTQPNTSTFSLETPIIVKKGTSAKIELKGNKTTVASDATENWGMADSAGANVTAYGLSTSNAVTETLTPDHGPTLTNKVNGTLTIETSNNPSSAILLAGSTGNVFSNVKLTAQDEDLRLDQLRVLLADGGYAFSGLTGEYRDVTNVALYVGTTKLGNASIPSTGEYTFNFDADTLTILKGTGNAKTVTIKADMSTIDPNTDNAPGTNSADLKIGFGGANGVKTTGKSSNTEISTTTYETYNNSTSSAMVLRSSKPTVALPTASARLGAASSLAGGGNIGLYAFKVTADASGGDVLLYRTTFVFATTGVDLASVLIKDQNGSTIKAAVNPTVANPASPQYYYTATFDNPDFTVDTTVPSTEAIKVPAGESRTFTVYGTVTNASTGDAISTFLVGDTASTSNEVNTSNYATQFGTPDYNFASEVGNFVWSDNYKQKNIEGTGGNNATTANQWYNGHLVPGLENAVSTTVYVVGY
ncbi:MAG: hypothetical protein A3A94_02555 [Candidatus Portnoybacteria bacterium RIFCSPLOWO2_01_FULL_43_11]|uniref:Uncharacterized protein n=3 Tax=Candidatus Portnoyibacteriota TaxID=1817913 RepID=A0A1G2FD51_9BACT|nr:MAG: hypothetical protein A2815_00745 [Candidatus Portnoybacteria bacterium RIFCSPHIGHO2_01_FULL_40_12b]OGZ38680.1 MAG: hypothetical protein A3A94_02555 [Candidatus Portnoybacteria bacterium RIFCSPLOWO2_01_FULL_43_11]OGZ41049.1 MAG: hypothetical protein A3I20_01235 [Candidatus Portnoybacteria bacterium RIFCSPLOWO2_02_FULL_40_15]